MYINIVNLPVSSILKFYEFMNTGAKVDLLFDFEQFSFGSVLECLQALLEGKLFYRFKVDTFPFSHW